MLKVRLKPTGRNKRISYRLVVAEEESKQGGKAIDDLGFYNPNTKPAQIKIDAVKLQAWLKKGAQISTAIRKLIDEHGKS